MGAGALAEGGPAGPPSFCQSGGSVMKSSRRLPRPRVLGGDLSEFQFSRPSG